MIEAFIFDMDGLLIDSEPIWRRVEAKVFGGLGLPVNEDDMRLVMGMRIDEVVGYWYQQHPWSKVSHEQVIEDIVDGVVAAIKAEGQALSGVDHVLSTCSEAGLPLAIASSSHYRIIEAVVEKLGIKDKFELIRSAQNEAFGKPHPAVFISTAKDLGVDVAECLVFEDSINGVIAAKAAKMKCIAVPEPENQNDQRFAIADMVIDSLEDFGLSMIDRLSSSSVSN